jgi:hypothetical protein
VGVVERGVGPMWVWLAGTAAPGRTGSALDAAGGARDVAGAPTVAHASFGGQRTGKEEVATMEDG